MMDGVAPDAPPTEDEDMPEALPEPLPEVNATVEMQGVSRFSLEAAEFVPDVAVKVEINSEMA